MREEIEGKLKEYFGENMKLKSMERLLGGAQKHTYLVTLENGFKFVIYVWSEYTNYFSDSKNKTKDIFLSSSPLLFKLNNKLMRDYHVKTPKLYYIDKISEEESYAIVEYIDGVDFDFVIANQPERLNNVIKSLKESLSNLHEIKSSNAGQLNNILLETFNPIKYSHKIACNDIDYLINVDSVNRDLYSKLKVILNELIINIDKREDFIFIHSELGPNHVIVDKNDNAYFIDIEGARFFDLEYEESFLKIRFGNNYKKLRSEGLDKNRVDFYHICHCCGYLSGAYELLNKDYYDKEDILGMIKYFRKAISIICLE